MFISFVFLTSMDGLSQVIKLKTTSMAIKIKSDYGTWGEWSEWSEESMLATIDLDKDRITIYSNETQIYDVAENEGETTDADGDVTFSLFCLDKDGLTCRIRLVRLNSQSGQNQLYVDYDDMRWVYNVYQLD